ncbi:MAG: Do family serine endopeptidase [Spirochaetales bacterium]|jgi:serine protease Do|nr:Do family serine endopeptidase [Spirochaetales bacterium]
MKNTKKIVYPALALCLLFGVLPAVSAQELNASEAAALEGFQNSLRKIAQRTLPVVVEVNVVQVVKQQTSAFSFGSPFEFFFGKPKEDEQKSREREFRQTGLGSGVIIRRDGEKVYVLTNNHVAGEANEITIKLNDGREYDAKLMGADSRRDLALLVFETKDSIPVATLGDSDKVQVGDWALALGNPLGFESTITFGIVSAVGRRPMPGMEVGNFTDYIQTDASINRGNSGGALVNSRGEVVGINTWIASQSGGSIGLGFAIPINNAKNVIEQIINKGSVEYGWLGVTSADPSKELREAMSIRVSTGAFVHDVFLDSPAYYAGIQPGDLIVRVGGQDVTNSTTLVQLVGNLVPGRTVEFQLIRFGETKTLQVRTAARKSEKEIAGAQKLWPGFSAVEMTEKIRRDLSLSADNGKVIIGNVTQGSSAASANLKTGDIIREINGRKIATIMDFYKAINEADKKEFMLRIHRSGNEFLIGIVK